MDNGRERVLMVTVNLQRHRQAASEDTLAELELLVFSAGGQVVGSVSQNRSTPNADSFIGKGKLVTVQALAEYHEADLLVFNNDLTPAQQRTIEAKTGVRTIDRTQLILDIFARRALSREGQLQVSLAQLQYILPRLVGRGRDLSRLAGGIGTRGPGETKLETDRRRIRSRIRQLQSEIDDLRQHRRLRRRGRRRRGLMTVALVGYTNSGKSTLLNALTSGGAIVEDKVFATLDPVTRLANTESGRQFLLTDTVGFISRLPHHLIASFRATLEEVTEADLLIHVVDWSSERAREQKSEVDRVLGTMLNPDDVPVVLAYNKIDALPPDADLPQGSGVFISALTGKGLPALLAAVDEKLCDLEGSTKVRLQLGHDSSQVIALLHEQGRVLSIDYRDDGVDVTAELDAAARGRLQHLITRMETEHD